MTEEQRRGRVHEILYSCESRTELAERIVGLEDRCGELEALVADMWVELPCVTAGVEPSRAASSLCERMRQAGLGCPEGEEKA